MFFYEVGVMNGNFKNPDSFVEGNTYFWRQLSLDQIPISRKVEFINYRPHPGEVAIRWRKKIKVIHRRYLFQENGSGKGDDQE